jgi:hypothetical protein
MKLTIETLTQYILASNIPSGDAQQIVKFIKTLEPKKNDTGTAK